MRWFPTPKIVLLVAVGNCVGIGLAFAALLSLDRYFESKWGPESEHWPEGAKGFLNDATPIVLGSIPLTISLADMVACTLLLIAGGHEGKEWAALILSMILFFPLLFFSLTAL